MKTLKKVFPIVRPYWTFVLSFGMPWGFVLASKTKDPLVLAEKDIAQRVRERAVKKLKYYHPGFHQSYFALPLYLLKSIKQGEVLNDNKPFIWKI